MMKICTKCKQLKQLTLFVKEKRKTSGYGAMCKQCRNTLNNSLDKKFYRSFYDSKRRIKNRPTYSELQHTLTWEQWLTFKAEYAKVYNKWAQNNFVKRLTPTIDRINNKKGYTVDNIQIIPYGENATKDQKGTDNHRAKLEECDVLAIRGLKNFNPNITNVKLAKIFNVSTSVICSILQRKSWSHC